MNLMLQNRARSNNVYVSAGTGPDRPWGVTVSWIGLLFAVLASGCQSSRLGVKERELTSQVYGSNPVDISFMTAANTCNSMLCLSSTANDELYVTTLA